MASPRRETWIFAGLGLNTLLSLTAIALWALAPQGRGASPSPSQDTASSRPAVASQPPRPLLARRPSPRSAPPALGAPAAPTESDAPRVRPEATPALAQLPQLRDRPVVAPASVVALGGRLNLQPEAIAAELGDAQGEISVQAAGRLERAFKTAEALAQRLGLDEGQSQSLTALFTFHAFSLLREEKLAAPGPVDPEQIEELTATLLNGLRRTCGEEVTAKVESSIAGL